MKSKITILLVTLFVLAFSAQAVAQTKDVALIYGAETQTTIVTDPVWAETILVQFNSELVDPTFSWSPAEWALVLVSCQHSIVGYSLLSFIRASSVVNCQLIMLFFEFLHSTQYSTSFSIVSMSSILLLRH